MASADATTERGVSRPDGGAGARLPLRRHRERGLVGGVCAGLAWHLGIPETLVRVVMGALVAFGGVGVALYALGWALLPNAAESEQRPAREHPTRDRAVAFAGVVLLSTGLRLTGVHFAEPVVWPAVIGVCGLALVWQSTVQAGRQPSLAGRWPLLGRLRRLRQIDADRLIVGVLLAAFASAGLLHTFGLLHSLGKAIGAVAFIALVLSLLAGPWAVRLGRSLASERAARIREQERADVAAHLHDSVLQTLALIQKRAADPGAVASLARRQERELRRWLFQRPGSAGGDSLKAALERAAGEVEELYGVPIEVVIVGERALDARLQALVLAAREAMANAAKFAGSDHVDLYAEVADGRAQVFVRDRGAGFDVESIPEDRRGVRDSIIGRVERHGGRVRLHSAAGAGTEVELAIDSPGP